MAIGPGSKTPRTGGIVPRIAQIAPMYLAITGTESWTLPNILGGVALFVVVILLASFAMSRSTK